MAIVSLTALAIAVGLLAATEGGEAVEGEAA